MKTDNGGSPLVWEVWLADVEFEDSPVVKRRPVLITDESSGFVTALEMTSTAPRTTEDFELSDWERAGLKHQTTVRTNRKVRLSVESLVHKIGDLCLDDIMRAISALSPASSGRAAETTGKAPDLMSAALTAFISSPEPAEPVPAEPGPAPVRAVPNAPVRHYPAPPAGAPATPVQWEVWLALTDRSGRSGTKKRPVTVTGSDGGFFSVLVMTGARGGSQGDFALDFWKEAGLEHPMSVRTGQPARLPRKAFITRIGTLAAGDIAGIGRFQSGAPASGKAREHGQAKKEPVRTAGKTAAGSSVIHQKLGASGEAENTSRPEPARAGLLARLATLSPALSRLLTKHQTEQKNRKRRSGEKRGG